MPPLRMPLSLAAATLATALLTGPRASAGSAPDVDPETKSAARTLGAEGQRLFEAGDYAGALVKFDRANTLVPAPTLGLRAARCLAKLGRLVEASERYLAVSRAQIDSRAPAVMLRAQEEARAERDALLPQIPTLTINVDGPTGDELTVLVDGKPIPVALLGEQRPTDPGAHKVEVKRPDTRTSGEVNLKPGDTAHLRLTLPKLPPAPSAPPPVLRSAGSPHPPPRLALTEVPSVPPYRGGGIVAVAFGGVGVALGVTAGALALNEAASLKGRCDGSTSCGPESGVKQSDLDLYNGERTGAVVGLAVGVVGLAVGVPLLLFRPNPTTIAGGSAIQMSPWVSFGGAGVRGIF
jgi:hypothetical protein